MTRTRFAAVIAALVLGAGAGEVAQAGSTTGNMSVTASVSSACTVTANTLAFTPYDPVTGTAVQGQTTLNVQCTKGAVGTLTLGQGNNAATGSTDASPARQMANGTGRLAYSLFQDGTRLVPWGNTALTGEVYLSLTASSTPVNVFGTITANQDVPAGNYSDTVVATLTF